MRIKESVKVLGRGTVYICDPDPGETLHCGDKVKKPGGKTIWEVTGVERMSHMKQIGVILRPSLKLDLDLDQLNQGDILQQVDGASCADAYRLEALKYINEEKNGYLEDLRSRLGDSLVNEFLVLGFIHSGYTLKEETWGLNPLGERYYKMVK